MKTVIPIMLFIGSLCLRQSLSNEIFVGSLDDFKTDRNNHFLQTLQCAVQNCRECPMNLTVCEKCEKEYKAENGYCVKNESKTGSISLLGMVLLIIGLVIFSALFCGICIYFANKHKPRYAGHHNIDGDNTKHVSYGEENSNLPSPSTFISSPEVNNEIIVPLDTNRIRSSLMKHIFKSLQTIKRDKNLKENCVICFQFLSTSDTKKLKCGHEYHYNCLKEWMMRSNEKCTSCQERIE